MYRTMHSEALSLYKCQTTSGILRHHDDLALDICHVIVNSVYILILFFCDRAAMMYYYGTKPHTKIFAARPQKQMRT